MHQERERERERLPKKKRGSDEEIKVFFFFSTIGECEKRELRTKWKKNNNKKKKKKERDGSFDASVAERLAAMQSSPRWQP